jgi:hypothetical protein
VILIEACEESGSYDLPYYVDHLAERIGKPSLVVCLDSGCANYDQLWCTRRCAAWPAATCGARAQRRRALGDASGIVPSSFRVLRQLLSRLEDEASGRILIEQLHVEIPEQRLQQAQRAAQVLGNDVFDKFPFLPGMVPMDRISPK